MEITLEEWAAEWFRIHTDGKLAPNTESGYRNLIFNHIVPKLGGAALTDLSEKRIRSFYRKLSGAGLNDRSVWCVRLLLRQRELISLPWAAVDICGRQENAVWLGCIRAQILWLLNFD